MIASVQAAVKNPNPRRFASRPIIQRAMATVAPPSADLHANANDQRHANDTWYQTMLQLSESIQQKPGSYAPMSSAWTASGDSNGVLLSAMAADRRASEPAEWSHDLSFSSPESDFAAANVPSAVEREVEWSHDMSFASPESDFVAANVASSPEHVEWSHDVSFASPESDFVAANVSSALQEQREAEWSQHLSFASPESDFVAADVASSPEYVDQHPAEWSQHLSFASPESDFVAAGVISKPEQHRVEWSQHLSFASPESDFVAANVESSPEQHRAEWSENFSFSSPESDFAAATNLLRMQQEPLPSTIEEALQDPRAIVITSAERPFEIEAVNDAWVGLCGFTNEEAAGRTLGELLQGPNTDRELVRSLVAEMRQESYAQGIVHNYTKHGREFRNFVRLAPISDKYLMGILQEISDESSQKIQAMQG